ncbi:alpha/beta fold hydrolase [Akkermansiaceae bacterium]|nr:alpha/beta fold hydrolase [Akkermansiaceae bacterium]
MHGRLGLMEWAAAMNAAKEKCSDSLLRRMLVRLGIWLALGLGLLYGVVVWWCAGEIAEPSRRPLSPAQSALLDGTEKAGFTVTKFVSGNGMPCLVCTPVATPDFTQRAKTIRAQIAQKGIALKPSGETIGTLVILHGRSGMKEDYLPVAERYCAIGFRCIIPDLPGHGAHPDRFATYGVSEGDMVLDCYREAAEELGFPMQPCAVLGQSMGGSVAVHAAALPDSPFGAMVVVATFDKLETVIRSQAGNLLGSVLGAAVSAPADVVFGWKTGVRISDIKPVDKAEKITIPTMVVHGDADISVPTAAGRELYAAFPDATEKQWLSVPGAAHNNVLVTDFPLYAAMGEWLLTHLPAARPASAPR